MVERWIVSYNPASTRYTRAGTNADTEDHSLVPLLLEKLRKAGIKEDEIKYITHRV
jgi:hypothetical protein